MAWSTQEVLAGVNYRKKTFYSKVCLTLEQSKFYSRFHLNNCMMTTEVLVNTLAKMEHDG